MPWADPKLMQSQLGPTLQKAGFGSSNPGYNPYWMNDPSKLQSGQGAWSSTPGLLSRDYPSSWYDPSSGQEPTSQLPDDSGAAASAAAGPKFGGYTGGDPSAYPGGISGLMNQMLLAQYNANSGSRGLGGAAGKNAPSGGYVPGSGGYGSPINATNNAYTNQLRQKTGGAGWELGTDWANNGAGSYQVPSGAAKGAPGSAYQDLVSNEYLRRLNEQASGGSKPDPRSALLGAGSYYGIDFQPLGGNANRGYSATLPKGTGWW